MSAQREDQATVRVLGPIGIWVDGGAVAIGGAKPRRLLAALVVQRNQVVSVDRLMDVLGGDDLPESGASTLQAYISRLRGVLPDEVRLVTEAPGYRLAIGRDRVDADHFESTMAAGLIAMADDPARALDQLDDALAQWRGDAFAEFADEPWALPEAARLEELRLHAREERVDAMVAVGLDERAIGEAQALTAEHPWREQPWRTLMSALHHVGRQGDALRVASEYRARLRDERGLVPSAELVELERRIAADDRTTATTPTSERSVRAIELIGREADVARVVARCDEHRVVTLVGPGGIGKTQLARRVAGELASTRTVVHLELAPVRDETSVVAAIATTLTVQAQQGRSVLDSVLDVLAVRQRPLLLVLDNCEHVLDAVASFVERLVARCPAVSILATSRAPLGLPIEVVDAVPALAVPDPDDDAEHVRTSPAVKLFLTRAAAANRERVVDDASVRIIAELCRRLDGMPLAIELAAARSRALSPFELNERLDDRFGLLSGTIRVADERHRSLRTLVDWSYQLLDPTEQELFRRLCTFAGTFDLDAAEQVCGYGAVPPDDVATVLASLVDKSMVQAAVGPRTTYRLLETLREYGGAIGADEDAEVGRRHGAWIVSLCERGSVGVHGTDEREWLDSFDRRFDDLRLAVQRALDDHDLTTAMRIVVAAREHAFRRLRYELIGWAEAALALDGADDEPLAAATLGIVAYGRFVRGESDAAIDLAERSLALADANGTDTLGLADRALGNACFFQGDMPGTAAAMERLVAGAVASGDDARIAHANYMRSLSETRAATADLGVDHAKRAELAAERSGNPTALAQASYTWGIWLASNDPEQALVRLQHAETLAREVGNRWFELFARTETLWLQALDGEPLAALAGYAAVLSGWHRAGDWANQWLSLRHVFGICAQVGADELAMIIHGALERAGAVDAFPFEPAAAVELARTADVVRERLGDGHEAFELQGRRASTSEVISLIVERIEALTATR